MDFNGFILCEQVDTFQCMCSKILAGADITVLHADPVDMSLRCIQYALFGTGGQTVGSGNDYSRFFQFL